MHTKKGWQGAKKGTHKHLCMGSFLSPITDIVQQCGAETASNSRPVSGTIVAIVGQEVIVELPEDVECYPAVRSRHIVVCLAEHGVQAVQSQELTEELVRHAVDLQKTFQFL